MKPSPILAFPFSSVQLLSGIVLLLSILFLSQPVSIADSLSAEQIMKHAYEIDNSKTSKAKKTLSLISENGNTRKRTIYHLKYDEGNITKSLIIFLQPSDVKNTSFLLHENESDSKQDGRWLFLPALKKTRRVANSSRGDYFMLTDFTFEDLAKREVSEDYHRKLKEESIEGILCHVIENISKDTDDVYGKRITWIDAKSWTTRKIDFFDHQNKKIKTLNASNFKNVQSIITPFTLTMENFDRKHKTIIEVESIEYQLQMKSDLFTQRQLERGEKGLE